MLEQILWLTNVAMLVYVCGRSHLTGCNSEKTKKDNTYRDNYGLYIYLFIYLFIVVRNLCEI